jgi:hypothetical protein
MDEIDAIGGKRFSEGTSADREIQRTLMELLNQMDGFEALGSVKVVMATNRPDILDPALMRPVRLWPSRCSGGGGGRGGGCASSVDGVCSVQRGCLLPVRRRVRPSPAP